MEATRKDLPTGLRTAILLSVAAASGGCAVALAYIIFGLIAADFVPHALGIALCLMWMSWISGLGFGLAIGTRGRRKAS